MELTNKDIEQLEALWAGQLGDEERLILEKRLETDKDFQLEAQRMRLVTEGLLAVNRQQMRQQLQDLEATAPPLVRPFKLRPVILWALGAAATLLIGFFIAQSVFSKGKIETPPLAFEAYPHDRITMGSSENTQELVKYAYIEYDKKAYKSAAVLLEKLYTTHQDTLSLLYAGIAFVGANDNEKGRQCLTQFNTLNADYADVVRWYEALSYVASDKETAVKLLTLLKERGEPYYKNKAGDLLKTLGR